jgi:hypothetical protein
MRKLAPLAVMAVVALLAVPSYGDFDWFNTSTNRVYYGNGTTLADGDASSAIGCFVQLIWAGVNGTFSTPINSGNGIPGGSDDQVHLTTWIGNNVFANPDGRYSGAGTFSSDSNGNYTVRFWSAPSPDYGNGLVPTSTTNRYAQVSSWANPGSEPPSGADQFNTLPNGGISMTLQAVPEPAIFGLGIIGLLSVRFFRRKK